MSGDSDFRKTRRCCGRQTRSRPHVGIGSDSDLTGYDHMPKDQYERLKAGYKNTYASAAR
jgi:hypothetical protein